MTELMKQEEKAVFSLRRLYQRFGYSQFKMSKFEPYDLYMQNKDFLVSDGVIAFTDTDGTLMALKPDVTLSIVKNFRKGSLPVQKVYYNENVYRIAGAGNTFREIMQTGLECMGDVSLYEICEVILLAAKSLQAISPDFMLDISHMQIVWEILSSLSLPFEKQAEVLEGIRDKSEDALTDYPDVQKLIRTCGPIAEIIPELHQTCSTDTSKQALSQLQAILHLLQAHGLEQRVNLDFSIVNDMNYYNGIVFRGYVEGIPAGVLSGGEYDKLMEKMGKHAKGIGFAVYLDQLERLDENHRTYDVDTVIVYSEQEDPAALSKAAEQVSADGRSVLLLKQIPTDLRYANLLNLENGRLKAVGNHG